MIATYTATVASGGWSEPARLSIQYKTLIYNVLYNLIPVFFFSDILGCMPLYSNLFRIDRRFRPDASDAVFQNIQAIHTFKIEIHA